MHVPCEILLIYVLCITAQDDLVDFNALMSPTWMPGTLLDASNGQQPNRSNSYSNITTKVLDGTINNALSTMLFHRSMINQYLCRSYVANQILSEVTKNSFKRRISDDDGALSTQKTKPNIMIDQGSSSYKDWLTKSSTLDDIYRNHNDKFNKMTYDADLDEIVENPSNRDYERAPSDHLTYNAGQYGRQPPQYFAHPAYSYSHHVPQIQKGVKLGDFFEIALTALAYLSFGLFIVHLIMSICAVSNSQTSTMNTRFVALNVGPAALNEDAFNHELDKIEDEATFDSNEYKYRSIKAPMKLVKTNNNSFTLNQLAKTVLKVFDSALIDDGGQCLRNSLCNASQFSRIVNGKGKLFMGLWCLGVSWLSERISNNVLSKTQSLEAIILGLGNANCDVVYQKCLIAKPT